MRVRRMVVMAGVLALAAACTSTPPTSVQGQQAPGTGRVAAEMKMDAPELIGSMKPGEASYIGASVDGSLIGFLMSDGYVRWFKTH